MPRKVRKFGKVRKPSKKFYSDGRSRARSRAARVNLKANGRRFRSIEAKMAYLRSLRGR